MARKNIATVRKIAIRVRKWAELVNELLGKWDSNLAEMCGICSLKLFEELRKEGLKPVFVVNQEHAYVLCNNHIVDVTATQFRKPYRRVEIRKADEKNFDIRHWVIEEKLRSSRSIRFHLNSWPDGQHPDNTEPYWKCGNEELMKLIKANKVEIGY